MYVSEEDETRYTDEILSMLERLNKELYYFRLPTIYHRQAEAAKASTALINHLEKHGGLLGRFRVQLEKKRTHRGMLWKAMAIHSGVKHCMSLTIVQDSIKV